MTTPTKPACNPAAGSGRSRKSEAPGAVPSAPRAKSNKTNSILSKAGAVLRAIFLSPVYQTLLAGIAAAGIILMEAAK